MAVAPMVFRRVGQPSRVEARRAYDRARDAANASRSWYKTARWRALRQFQLLNHPLCAYCLRDGVTTLATICDHDPPHRGDETAFWAGPFQSLCKTCHDGAKQREEADRAARDPSRPR